MAMGESFVAVANDVSAIFWNPAGLARLNSKELSASHHAHVQGINYESLAYGQPTALGTFGAGVNYLYLDSIERRGKNEEPQGSFGASDFAFTLSFARALIPSQKVFRPLSQRLVGGINLKIIRQSIDTYSASAYAMDMGILTPLRNSQFTLGIAIQNIGSDIQFLSESYALPQTLRIGLSWSAKKAPVTVAGGFSAPRDNSPSYEFGSEYWVIPSFALRSGYMIRPQNDLTAFKGLGGSAGDNAISKYAGFMAGIGLKFHLMQVDYAFVPLGDLGTTHRVTLGMKFK